MEDFGAFIMRAYFVKGQAQLSIVPTMKLLRCRQLVLLAFCKPVSTITKHLSLVSHLGTVIRFVMAYTGTSVAGNAIIQKNFFPFVNSKTPQPRLKIYTVKFYV